MSIFNAIKNAIFGKDAKAAAPSSASQTASKAPVSPSTIASKAPTHAAQEPVDVEAVVERYAANTGQKLNWQTSIVDLLKALGIDSSIANRKQLAAELGYVGDTNDSATMNIWLHKQVMKKLVENGGKVPHAILNA